MKTYYSDYNSATGTLGKSLTDFGNTTFNQIISSSGAYSGSTTYAVGATVLDQGVVWRCILSTTGNAPPTLPTVSNTFWEYVGSQGNFTWIAYGDSADNGVTITNISTTTAGTRQWLGVAYNKSNTNETTVQSDYTWSKIKGTDGVNGTSPITVNITKPSVSIPTDSNGLNQSYTSSSGTQISVLEGINNLTYDGVGTGTGKWAVTSATANTIATLTTVSITGTAGQFSCAAASITLVIGMPVILTGTSALISGQSGVKTYYIIATNGSTTFTLSATPGGAGVTTIAGTPGALTYTIPSIVPGTPSVSGATASYTAVSAMFADTATIDFLIQGTTLGGTTFSGLKITQTFSMVKGAVLDNIAPSPPTSLTYANSTSTLPGGNIQVKLKASWVAPTTNSDTTPLTDLSYYEVSIKLSANADSTYIAFQTSSTSYEWIVDAGTNYTVRVRAVDKNGNISTYLTGSSTTSGTVSTIPGPPTAVTAVATFKNVFLSWTNISDSDLSSVEIWRNTTNNSDTATRIATVNASASSTGGFADSNSLVNGTLYYYWLKSKNTSGNVSTSFSTLVTSTLTTVVIAGTAGQFTCASTTISIGQVVIISGTFGGTGSITGYTNPKTYVISATNGTTSFTLVNTDGTPLVTTAGTPTGLTYTKHQSAGVPAAVGAADIIAGSITADRIRAGELTADLIAVPASGGLNPLIQVGTTGVGIGNPIGLIENNPAATTISPGKILISGGTTLSSWRNGTDATKIEGGSIAANTISANSISVGSRGVTFTGIQFTASSTTSITWTAGTVSYTDDTSILVNINIAAQTAAVTRTATNTTYFYWVKGATTIASTTVLGTATGADRILIATWVASSTTVNANYGRTIIDGSSIVTNSITANQIQTNSITADRIDSRGLSIKDAGGAVIFASGTPLTWDNISSTGIPTTVDNGQTGVNRANIQYSEFNQSTIPTLTYNSSTAGYSSAIDATSPPITGIGSIRLTTSNTGSSVAYAFLGTSITDYNIVLKPNTTYLLSAYVKSTTASAGGSLRFRLDDVGTDTVPVAFTTSATVSTWTRVSGTFTTNATTTSGVVRLANLTNNCSIWYAGIMVEEAMGSSVTAPSPYVAPSINGQITAANSSTYIASLDAGVITAGTINTDRLNIGGTTIEKNPTSGYLQIKALGVDTAFITDNAVSVVTSTYTAGTINFSNTLSGSAVPIDLVTPMTVVTSGIGTVTILVNLEVTGGTASGSYGISVIRDGTTTIETGNGAVNGSTYTGFTYVFTDSPTAGTHTYKITATSAGSPGIYTARKRFLMVMENKK